MSSEANPYNIVVKIAGKELSSGLITAINISKEINRIPWALITIIDGDPSTQTFTESSSANYDTGKEVEVSLGFVGKTATTVFKGIIIKHGLKIRNGQSVLTIECKDKACKMAIAKKNAFFDNKTDKDVIETLVGNYGVTASITGTMYKHVGLVQYNATDWDFAMTRIEKNGMIAIVDEAKLTIKEPKLESASITIEYGKDILEFESEIDARSQYETVNAKSWDVKTQALITSAAPAASFNQLSGTTSSAVGKDVAPSSVDLVTAALADKDELTAWGKSRLAKNRLSKVRGRIKLVGRTDIAIGATIKTKGLGTKFSGDLLVSGIKHELNSSGWHTHIQFGLSPEWYSQSFEINEEEASGLLPAVHGLQIGKVTKIDADPDSKYRIQVKLPLVSDTAKIWARMAFADAGKERGIFFLPEVDDEVIIGFFNNDPRHPVILGMLYSNDVKPPYDIAASNDLKGITTRAKLKINFDDKGKSIEIITPGKNSIKLDDEGKSILLKDQHGNEIKMDQSAISITSKGDLKLSAMKKISISSSGGDVAVEGLNVKNTAKAKFEASGNAGTDVKSSAIVTIQGSLVKIN